MPGKTSEQNPWNKGKFCLLCLLVVVILAMVFGWGPCSEWNPTQLTGYCISTLLLAVGLMGLWIPKTHLFHQQVFRFMAYCAIFVFSLTFIYSVAMDIIQQIQAPAPVQAQEQIRGKKTNQEKITSPKTPDQQHLNGN